MLKLDISKQCGQALEIMENLENHKKVPCMEKSWNLKNLNNHGKIKEFYEII